LSREDDDRRHCMVDLTIDDGRAGSGVFPPFG
jgi:hypothetical protein